MIIPVKTSSGNYDIILERGAINKSGEYLNLERKVLIVTDSGVPTEYSSAVAANCKTPYTVTVEQGESSKNIKSFELLLSKLVEYGFTRSDCIVAVGGGVVGDLSGFAASAYMRGIDFYNIPTTLLSQVDSSIGGKTAIDFMGIKNIVGAFYPPKRVIIDPETLKTLPERQISNGLAESLKMALTHDKELLCIFEEGDVKQDLDLIIERSLKIKKSVIEQDEHEGGLRRVLNFGHTLAHAIEAENEMKNLFHGECVALGMIPMCSPKIRERLKAVLKKLGLPTEYHGDIEKLVAAASHDKKFSGEKVTVITLPEIENFKMEEWSTAELFERMEEFFK